MGFEVLIRAAEADEGDEVGVLTEGAYRHDGFYDEDYSQVLLDGASRVRDAIVLVAVLDERIVGTVTVAVPGTPYAEICRPDELEVRMLAVAPEARRRGIADLLMDATEDHARALGLTGVVLSTSPLMHAAHRLYERRGYVRIPERDWQVEEYTLITYRLELT